MPDYKKLYYESQAQLANVVDELRKLVFTIQQDMRDSEESIISDESNEQE